MKTNPLTPLKLFLFFTQSIGFICTSYLPLYLLQKGYSPSEVGVLLAIGPFASLISEPMSGYLSDKFKSIKKVLLACIIGMLVAGIVLFQLNSFAAIAVSIYVLFFFLAPSSGLGDSLSQKTANQMKVSFGSIRMWGALGFGISSVTLGYLLSYIGVNKVAIPFVIFSVIMLILVLFLKDVKVDDSVSVVKLTDAFSLIKNVRFMLFLGIVLLITLGHRANDMYLSVYIKELGGSETIIGWAFLAGVITEVFVFYISGFWYRKLHDLTFIMIAAVLYSVRFIGMAFATTPLELIFYQLLHGVTFGVFLTVAISYVTKIVPVYLQSTGHVLLISVLFGYSGMLSALIGGKLIESYSTSSLYILIGCSALLGAVLLFIFKKFNNEERSVTLSDAKLKEVV